MKSVLKFVVIAALAAVASSSLLAQSNPLVGTWKLNTAKSSSSPMPVPKSLTRTVTAEGDGAKYVFEGVAADGSPIAYGFTVAFDGKEAPITGSGPGGADTISIKRINPNEYEATLKKAGKTVATAKAEVSKDGKVSTVTSKGTGSDGKPMSTKSVYDKQ
jgi:hypothetical protein